MLHCSSNRGTPVSGENITKIVRQHYKPACPKSYRPELVQCRTSTFCKKSKPEDYWTVNYHRRKYNLNNGFNTEAKEPYRPIGDLILDPYELVCSSLSGSVEKKFQPRMTRRGTIYEADTPTKMRTDQEKFEKGSSCLSEDSMDNCPTAGFEDIKKLLRESRERITNVKGGRGYEDHVKQIEEKDRAEQEANKPDDSGMFVHSLSSVCLPMQARESRSPSVKSTASRYTPSGSAPSSGDIRTEELRRDSMRRDSLRHDSSAKSVERSTPSLQLTVKNVILPEATKKKEERRVKESFGQPYSHRERHKQSICVFMDRTRSPPLVTRGPVPILNAVPSSDNSEDSEKKVALIQCSSGITAALVRKERQFKDHHLYLTWIYNVLNAIHNMKVKDLRSKIPLPKDLVERLQREGYKEKEEDRGSKGAYGNSKWVMRKGCRTSNTSFKDVNLSTEDNVMHRGHRMSNTSFKDMNEEFVDNNLSELGYSYNENSSQSPEVLPTKRKPQTTRKPNIFAAVAAQKLAISKFGRSTRASTMEVDEDTRYTVYGAVKRNNAMDSIGKSFFGRRRSRNATSLSIDTNKPLVETWEDLVNIQPQEYKEEPPSFGLQVGIVSKFMRWYRAAGDNNRRASITPTHAGGGMQAVDQDQLSRLSQIHEKNQQQSDQPKHRESNYGINHHQSVGSAQGHVEKTKKMPIWQQVAQEKSTVFHHQSSKPPNPDTAILRFKRDLNKLKISLQKENTAELEKLVRERVANFRLKFGTLDSEEVSCLFEEQLNRISDVKINVNKSHLENFDVQPSKWYEELRERSMALLSSFDHPQITDTINQLQTYAHMDNKTVAYAKAKLCLLMMSLPAYDICQIYVQKALKFVFENILLGTNAQFNEWLNQRKIPYMVINDSQRPKSNTTPGSMS